MKKHPKWFNVALDWYWTVEDNKKNGVLFEPFIPSIDPKKQTDMNFVKVEYPITFQTIGNLLNLGLYKNIDEFKKDMDTMFSNQWTYFSKQPKLLKILSSIESRFNSFKA